MYVMVEIHLQKSAVYLIKDERLSINFVILINIHIAVNKHVLKVIFDPY